MLVYVGYDPREADGFKVTKSSILKHNPNIEVIGIEKSVLESAGIYRRPTAVKNGKLFDVISNAPMATEFALTRFLVPFISRANEKWVLFIDCDMMINCDLETELLPLLDEQYAVMCVKHNIEHGTGFKMDDCQQTSYNRKNWSSVVAWNLDHPAHENLTLDDVNGRKGLWLHQFLWLDDHEIGELDKSWNHLVGLYDENKDAKIVHYTLGVPRMEGYENCEWSKEWFEELARGY